MADTKKTGVIFGINGPVIYLEGDPGFQMNEMVYVGEERLVGEVIGLTLERTIIQVYEETSRIKPGQLVYGSGAPVSVTLAPGILSNIFDGIQRPLSEIAKTGGPYINRGVSGEKGGLPSSGGHHSSGSGNQGHCSQDYDSPVSGGLCAGGG